VWKKLKEYEQPKVLEDFLYYIFILYNAAFQNISDMRWSTSIYAPPTTDDEKSGISS
jgi:hypothetical protein